MSPQIGHDRPSRRLHAIAGNPWNLYRFSAGVGPDNHIARTCPWGAMKRLSIYALTMATALATAAPALAADPSADSSPAASYIVQFTPGSDRAAEVSQARALGMKVNAEYRYAISGMSVEANAGQLRALQANPNVQLIEKDAIATTMADQSGATWGLDRIDQRDLPLNGVYSYSQTAANVTAYVVDTGILASHQQFGGRVRSGFDAVTTGGSATDCDGHGTHVAGTIGSATYGVAKSVTLVPVRVLGCTGSGTTTDILEGIDYVIADHAAGTPAVANFSLGYQGIVSTVDDAMARLVADGVTVVIAAGNSNVDACGVTPARTPTAITVGSTTSTDARSSFSNFGTCLDIFAPGSSITSTWYTSTSAINTISGTSMASPHVAGAAALYLAANPTASPATVTSALTANATANKVTSAGTGSANRLLFVGTVATPAAPTITSLAPATATPGTVVSLTGANLTGATRVAFGATNATYTITSDTTASVTVPSVAAGAYQVTVTTSGGTSAGAAFTVESAPVVPAPAAPTGLSTVSVSRGGASVKWTGVSGATSYQVRLGTGTWVAANGVTAHTFSGLRKNTNYTWYVRALNGTVAGASSVAGTFKTLR